MGGKRKVRSRHAKLLEKEIKRKELEKKVTTFYKGKVNYTPAGTVRW